LESHLINEQSADDVRQTRTGPHPSPASSKRPPVEPRHWSRLRNVTMKAEIACFRGACGPCNGLHYGGANGIEEGGEDTEKNEIRYTFDATFPQLA
jgi:hypothetical protein